MKETFFSILVPIYNSEEHLDECINSVCNQDYINWELILVDDGSTDNSKKICDKYCDSYNNIFYYRKENSGQMDTRRNAILKAKGDYCIFLDSDDMLEKNALKILNRYIKIYNCDCIIYGLKRIDNNYNVIDTWKDSKIEVIKEHERVYKKILLDKKYNSLCRKAVKREKLTTDKKGLFIEKIRYAEDLLESINIFNNVDNVLFVPDILYIYRMNQHSMTHSVDYERLLKDTIVVNEKIVEYIKAKNYFNENDFYKLSTCYTYEVIDIIRGISIAYEKNKKENLYNELNKSNLFNDCILKYRHSFKDLGKKYIIFELYKNKRYKCIFTIEKTYEILKKKVQSITYFMKMGDK